jgi:hypothetical protein
MPRRNSKFGWPLTAAQRSLLEQAISHYDAAQECLQKILDDELHSDEESRRLVSTWLRAARYRLY